MRRGVIPWGIMAFLQANAIVSAGAAATMCTASRTGGVAPLAVFFDAVDPVDNPGAAGGASGVFQPPNYADCEYRWDFGDPNCGTWTPNGRSKNEATGYLAAHVYEAPGTYTVTLWVDNATDHRTYTQAITVKEFRGITYYVSNSHVNSSDGNPGTSPGRPLRSFEYAMTKLGTNVRILFRSGDLWTTDGDVTVNAAGPGVIGCYGEGPAPVIKYNGYVDRFFTIQADDWRVMGLSLAGDAERGVAVAFRQNPTGTRLLLLNLKIRDFVSGAANSDNNSSEVPPSSEWNHDQWYIVGCDIGPIGTDGLPSSGEGLGCLGGRRTAILGNVIHDLQRCAEHGVRIWHAQKLVLCDNSVTNEQSEKHSLKLHAWVHPLGDTRYVIIADNTFCGEKETVKLAPQDQYSAEYVQEVIFERNTLRSMSTTMHCVFVQASRVTLRNNILIGNGGSRDTNGFHLERWNRDLPAPTDIQILNNTLWRSQAGGYCALVDVAPEDANVVVARNNIVSVNASYPTVVTDPWDNLTEDHNLLHDAVADAAIFHDPEQGNFRLLDGPATVDCGVAVAGVLADFSGVPRPQRGGVDLGAFELGWTLGGILILQDYTSDVTGVPISVEFRNSEGGKVKRTVHLAGAGGNCQLEDVAAGAYEVGFKASHWLRKVIRGVTLGPDNPAGISGTLLNGDVNGDNRITFEDFAVLQNHYGHSVTPDTNGDLNGDGVVNFQDFAILQNAYGRRGDTFENGAGP